jgi:aspartyl-tRNA(Asn)/glutamyl-tRNA(Gln) amidotransferase subunit A
MGQELSRRSFIKIAGVTAASGAVLGTLGVPAMAAREKQAGAGSKAGAAGNLTGYIPKAGKMLRKGDLTSEALTRNYLENIKKLQPELNAFITLMEEQAWRSRPSRLLSPWMPSLKRARTGALSTAYPSW